MPRLADDDAGSDVDVFEETMAEVDTDAKKQLNGELKDKVDEDEDEAGPVASDTKDADEDEPEVRGKGEAEDEVDDDEGPEASEFNVESIQKHKIVKGDLLYFIKWQGWDESDNTWEPEEHLLPHSKQILTNYFKKIGGRPEVPIKKAKSKQNLRAAASTEDLPTSKRQQRNGDDQSEEPGTWTPKGRDWEDQVDKVETIERNEETDQLMAYIRFKNGKRSKITMEMVYQHCPRPMLRFYESNLKFN